MLCYHEYLNEFVLNHNKLVLVTNLQKEIEKERKRSDQQDSPPILHYRYFL
jgi:hypothetical protein